MIPVAMLSNGCPSIARPIPHMAFHATGDALTSYADDQELAENIAELNGCSPITTTVYYGGPNTSTHEVACFKEPCGAGSPDAMDPDSIPLSALPRRPPRVQLSGLDRLQEGVEVQFCTVAADTQELAATCCTATTPASRWARSRGRFSRSSGSDDDRLGS